MTRLNEIRDFIITNAGGRLGLTQGEVAEAALKLGWDNKLYPGGDSWNAWNMLDPQTGYCEAADNLTKAILCVKQMPGFEVPCHLYRITCTV